MQRSLALPLILALVAAVSISACGEKDHDVGNSPPRIEPVPPTTVQAGQLLTIDVVVLDDSLIPPTLSGTIRGSLITSGFAVPFDQMEGVELDQASGRLQLRVPPREVGSLEIRFQAVDGVNPALVTEEIVPVTVTPPNLFDAINVDGVLDTFEAALIASSSQGGLATVQMYDLLTITPTFAIAVDYEVATDAEHAYLRVTWEDSTEDRLFDLNVDLVPQENDIVQLQFDQDGDGIYEDGEDRRACFTYQSGSGCIDQHQESNPALSEDDPAVDGVARMEYDPVGGTYTAEFLILRTPDADGFDPDLSPGRRVPFNLFFLDGVGETGPTPQGGGLFGIAAPDASAWGDFPLPLPLPGSYAPTATPTQGTLICISNHEDPKGEVYEIDLASGSLLRLTTNNRYEDWVSVSPDGSFAAYGSSTDKSNYMGYEIYKWERSTGQETPLTNDLLLDGHPGISPDNQRIVYVTFGPTGTADIYIMDRDGGNIVRVTNNAVEENDPEWTKDGRLVIKSSQWSGRELMAVMDEDGLNLTQLTSHLFSDHDGMVSPDNRWVLYERFEDSVQWNQDWNITNSTSWTIRMVSLDGLEERLLVETGLVNWLPVMGPEEVIAYFRSTSFNGLEVRMIDRFGVDLGRIAPGESKIRYMDWK